MTTTNTYRSFLQSELSLRIAKNPRYGLNSFARDLGLSPGQLSLVLNGKRGLSVQSALKVTSKLNLSPTQKQLFCDSVEQNHARSPLKRKLAEIRLKKNKNSPNELVDDTFRVISDWYHLAILELTKVKGFKGNVPWISTALDVPPASVKDAIARLVRLNLLDVSDDKKFKATDNSVPGGAGSEAIRKFHIQVLNAALESVSEQSVDERDLSTMMFAFNSKDMSSVKEEIRTFRRHLCSTYETQKNADDVYCLAIQFFSLMKK